jgi:Spy/CpxP family protein refolding chaperone
MKKLVLVLAVLVLGVSSAWGFGGGKGNMQGGFACGMGGMQGGCGLGINPNCPANVNLTDDQQAQFQSRHDAFVAEISPLRDELFSKKMELRELWAAEDPSQVKITAKQQEIRELQAQMQEKATEYQLECRQMLTPEQREKMIVAQSSCRGKGLGQGCRMGCR